MIFRNACRTADRLRIQPEIGVTHTVSEALTDEDTAEVIGKILTKAALEGENVKKLLEPSSSGRQRLAFFAENIGMLELEDWDQDGKWDQIVIAEATKLNERCVDYTPFLDVGTNRLQPAYDFLGVRESVKEGIENGISRALQIIYNQTLQNLND